MPNGQPDYLGIDEGATVGSESLRVHTGSGNVAGSGFGVNNFAAIYKKNFPAGLNVGVTKATGNSGIDFYGLAVATGARAQHAGVSGPGRGGRNVYTTPPTCLNGFEIRIDPFHNKKQQQPLDYSSGCFVGPILEAPAID